MLAQIGEIQIDVVRGEVHDFPSDITQNPVEDGTVFSDHVVLLPVVIELEGRVSEASLTVFGIREQNRHIDAFQGLVELQRRREPFTVVTGIQVYENMMFTSLTIDRNRIVKRLSETRGDSLQTLCHFILYSIFGAVSRCHACHRSLAFLGLSEFPP